MGNYTRALYIVYYVLLCLGLLTYWDKQNASEQRASQCCLHYFLKTLGTLVMSSKQGCDVKCKLSYGPKSGINHCTDCEVTLS